MERLGEPGNEFRQMGFSIEKAVVEARGRALKAQYSMELAQDLRAIHGLDAEAELANILSALRSWLRSTAEVVRTVYQHRTPWRTEQRCHNLAPSTWTLTPMVAGALKNSRDFCSRSSGTANAIAQLTRRGKGNMIICSADVASALTMAGVLDYTPALNANLNVDDTGNLFAGTINGKLKVYIDPYSANVSDYPLLCGWLQGHQQPTTLACSTALMCPCRWFAASPTKPSSLTSASRPVMV